jgi:GT2 family glycosyltransferase
VSVDASIIIVNWNGRRFLAPCLDAVRAQAGVTHETILVDNGSEDGSVAFVRQHYPWVRVVALQRNRGFAGGNNAGAAVAEGRELVFLNNDTEAGPGWLRALCAGVDEPAGVLLASSRVVYMHDPDVLDSAGDGVLRWGGAFKWHHGAPVTAAPESREVFAVCGAACLVRRRVFEELGGFDDTFFASHEDVDLSYRARLRGYRCRYVADAVVRHHGSATLGRLSEFAVFQGQRNLEWMYLKNTPGRLLARTLPGHAVYTAAAAVHFARTGHLGTFLRAKAAALAGLPRVWRARRAVQAARVVPAGAIAALLERDWLGIKRREKRFDRELAS